MDEVRAILDRVLAEQFAGTPAQREYVIRCIVSELGLRQVSGSTIDGQPVWVQASTKIFYRNQGSRAYDRAEVTVADEPSSLPSDSSVGGSDA